MQHLQPYRRLIVSQVFELAEFFGFETRNKYRIRNEAGQDIAYAAEQQKSFLGMIMRHFFGHWRTFDIHFYTPDRQEFMIAHHPFRWFFQRLDVSTIAASGGSGRPLGSIERRWSILSKRFHVHNPQGHTVMEVHSPFWKIWTFPFTKQGREVARISKKWSGFGSELFTDRDNFLVEMPSEDLSDDDRALILAAAVYIDLMFFERKGNGGVFGN